MGKSQLLKDLVTDATNLENILLRLKVILTDLKDEKIIDWVNGEIQGYQDQELPAYRRFHGELRGTYIVNQYGKYTNAPVPLKMIIGSDLVDELTMIEMRDGISAIQNLLKSENRDNMSRTIPSELGHMISRPDFQILNMYVLIPGNKLDKIVSGLKLRLIEVITEIEKGFENIDDLDISSQVEEASIVAESVVYNIQKIVFGDTTEIDIGDKNKFKESSIGRFFRREK